MIGKQQEERKAAPKPPKKKPMDVIGSSCIWGGTELEMLTVDVEWDVNVRDMILEAYFDFSELKNYEKCAHMGCRADFRQKAAIQSV